MTLSRPLLALACLLAAACSASAAPDGRLMVATTVAPLTSIVSAIGGDRVQVHGTVPEGSDSHTYEPPPQVAETLAEADVVFVNGLRLEDPTAELARTNAKKGAEGIALGTLVLPESQYLYDFSFPRKGGKPNPHLWTDPPLAAKYAAVVESVLSRRDPAHRRYYAANLAAFTRKVDLLSQAMRTAQATLPVERRRLLTYHDAYAYFGRDFGWTIIGAVQPANFEDPTASEVARLIDQVRREKVPVIFGSEVFPSTILKQIGKETGARYEDTLRDDDLPGRPGDAEHSWLGLMRYDFRTMVSALGGDAAALDALDLTGLPADRASYPQ